MAYTAPRTWVTGELVTAAMMNTHVRDNMVALHDQTTVPAAKVGFINSAGAIPADNSWRVYTGTTTTYIDTDTMAGTALLTIKTAGKYLVIVAFYSGVVGNVHVYSVKNTTTIIEAGNINPSNAGDLGRATAHAVSFDTFAVNDTIKAAVSHSAGVTTNNGTFTIQALRIAN